MNFMVLPGTGGRFCQGQGDGSAVLLGTARQQNRPPVPGKPSPCLPLSLDLRY